MKQGARALVLALCVIACGRADRAEALAVRTAIDRLRSAPRGSERRPLVDALEKLPVHTEEAERARDACVVAYRRLLEEADLVARAGASHDPIDIAQAESKLDAARATMPACDQAAFELSLSLR